MIVTETQLHIRRANHSDSGTISSILLHSFIPYKTLYTKQAFDATVITPEAVLQRMNEGAVFLAIYNDKEIGTVSIVFKEEGCYVRGMAVLPEAQGRKVGYRLLKYIEQAALDNGIKRLYLCTTPFLFAAIQLYDNFGFKRIGMHYDDFFGTHIFSMEKHLTK